MWCIHMRKIYKRKQQPWRGHQPLRYAKAKQNHEWIKTLGEEASWSWSLPDQSGWVGTRLSRCLASSNKSKGTFEPSLFKFPPYIITPPVSFPQRSTLSFTMHVQAHCSPCVVWLWGWPISPCLSSRRRVPLNQWVCPTAAEQSEAAAAELWNFASPKAREDLRCCAALRCVALHAVKAKAGGTVQRWWPFWR